MGISWYPGKEPLPFACSLGWLGYYPTQFSSHQFHSSLAVSALLVDLLVRQDHQYSFDLDHAQHEAGSELKIVHCLALHVCADELYESLSHDLKLAVTLAQEKGTSSLLTALPIAEHNLSFRNRPSEMTLHYDMDGNQLVCL